MDKLLIKKKEEDEGSKVIEPTDEKFDAVMKMSEKDLIEEISFFSNGTNMKKLKTEISIDKKLKKFKLKMNSILDNFESKVSHDDLDIEKIFLFVMQASEDYINSVDETVKDYLCLELLKRFMKNDKKMTETLMRVTKQYIKKTSLWRRNKKRILKLMAFFLKKVLNHI